MKKAVICFAIYLLPLLLSFSAEAQLWRFFLRDPRFTKKKKYVSYGASVGAVTYFGDIAPQNAVGSTDLQFVKPTISLYAQKKMTQRMNGRISIMTGQISGDDAALIPTGPTDMNTGRYIRNLHFRNSLFEVSAVATFDLYQNLGVYFRRQSHPVPYFLVGVGALYSNPQARVPQSLGGGWENLRPLQTEGRSYLPVHAAIPLGFGVRWRIADNIDIGVEAKYRFTSTDYLDDVSNTYVDKGSLSSDLARVMSDRSLETTAARTGDQRDFTLIPNGLVNYVSAADGRVYRVFDGFGNEGDKRGTRNFDSFITFGFHAYYILPGTLKTPKFRSGRRR